MRRRKPSRARALREPQGGDELALAGIDTHSAVQLLDRLIDAPPCSTAQLSASDRDGLLAALHRSLWGDRIVSSLKCAACGAMFDLSFETVFAAAALDAARRTHPHRRAALHRDPPAGERFPAAERGR